MKKLFFIAFLFIPFTNFLAKECCICLEQITKKYEEKDRENYTHLTCNHTSSIHTKCLENWLTQSNNSCPLCRAGNIIAAKIPHKPYTDTPWYTETALKRYFTRSGQLSIWRTREFIIGNATIRWSPFLSPILSAFAEKKQLCRLDQKTFSGWVQTIQNNSELANKLQEHLQTEDFYKAALFAALQKAFPWSETFQKALNDLPKEAANAHLYHQFTDAFKKTGMHATKWQERFEVVYINDIQKKVFKTSDYCKCIAQMQSCNDAFYRYYYD